MNFLKRHAKLIIIGAAAIGLVFLAKAPKIHGDIAFGGLTIKPVDPRKAKTLPG